MIQLGSRLKGSGGLWASAAKCQTSQYNKETQNNQEETQRDHKQTKTTKERHKTTTKLLKNTKKNKKNTKKFKITTRRLKMITKKHKIATETHRDDGDKKQRCAFCVSFHLQDDFWTFAAWSQGLWSLKHPRLHCFMNTTMLPAADAQLWFWPRSFRLTRSPFIQMSPTVSPVLFPPAGVKSTKPPSTSPSWLSPISGRRL